MILYDSILASGHGIYGVFFTFSFGWGIGMGMGIAFDFAMAFVRRVCLVLVDFGGPLYSCFWAWKGLVEYFHCNLCFDCSIFDRMGLSRKELQATSYEKLN